MALEQQLESEQASYLQEAALLLKRTAPKFDFAALAQLGVAAGILSAREAEEMQLYGKFPSWLSGALTGLMQSLAEESQVLLPEARPEFHPPVGQHVSGLLTKGFIGKRGFAAPVRCIQGGSQAILSKISERFPGAMPG